MKGSTFSKSGDASTGNETRFDSDVDSRVRGAQLVSMEEESASSESGWRERGDEGP